MAKRIAYLGPQGTFTEDAALLHDKTAQLIPFPSIPAVAVAVVSGMAEEGVVAIENSLEGSVTDTLDLLIHESGVFIRKELVLPIEHYLLVKPGTEAGGVKVLYSHPQALGQCRNVIERCFPKVNVVAALSNAAAVEEMMVSTHPAAAIGTRRAAELYGAEILARGIQDKASNVTRFVVLASTDHPADDRPGVLCEVLQKFAERNINLAKIESRPSKESLGRYIFLIDIEGHHDDVLVSEVLKQVREVTSLFKVFGSYPRYGIK